MFVLGRHFIVTQLTLSRCISILGRTIPGHIEIPYYAQTGVLKPKPLKSSIVPSTEYLNGIKKACSIAKNTLDAIGNYITPGISTAQVDTLVYELIIKQDGYPVPLNFHGFPKSVCTSVNEVVLHGIPNEHTVLSDGDIINIDVTVYYKGYYGDVSQTFPVGKVSDFAASLIRISELAVNKSIELCKPGTKLSAIGNNIQFIAESNGFQPSPFYCGHGLGDALHLYPDILHHANNRHDVMKTGMVFTIEPAIMSGNIEVDVLPDKWTVVSRDRKWSAQHERVVYITNNGCEVLT